MGVGTREMPSESRDGESHGKYRILAQLGEGGMATVFLAVARGPSGFNKLVVLKALKREFADDPDFRKMFLREAQLAARLNHPGVVQTYEVFETVGSPLIVMEYLDGQTLANVRQRAKETLGLARHLRIIGDATGALHYAHELTDFDGRTVGLVHRDMTPHNVFVTFDGQVKLLDFGIAKLTTASPETQMGVIKGKLRYMPPEQIAGDPVDRRADIYAVGVMLWEAATGQPMWKGYSDVAVMKRVIDGEIPSPRSVAPQVPEQLEAICMKALSPDRADRFATAAELEADIDAFLDDLGSRVTGRSLAKFVSTLFADTRAETKALIEARLSKVALLPIEAFETLASEDLDSLSLHAHGAFPAGEEKAPLASTVTKIDGAGDASAGRADPRRRRHVVLGLGALGFVGIIGVAIGLGNRSMGPTPPLPTRPPPPVSAAGAAARPAPSATAIENRVSIHIAATPKEATLRLDGELLATNPALTSRLADGSQHEVTAEAPGYQSAGTAFMAQRDTDLVVDLERTRAVPLEPQMRTPPTPPVQPSPPRARGVSCTPPFLVDSSGIKRFKLECL